MIKLSLNKLYSLPKIIVRLYTKNASHYFLNRKKKKYGFINTRNSTFWNYRKQIYLKLKKKKNRNYLKRKKLYLVFLNKKYMYRLHTILDRKYKLEKLKYEERPENLKKSKTCLLHRLMYILMYTAILVLYQYIICFSFLTSVYDYFPMITTILCYMIAKMILKNNDDRYSP